MRESGKGGRKSSSGRTAVKRAPATGEQATSVPRISEAFARIAAALRREGGIDDEARGTRRAFGADALKVGGKIFAMPVKGRLVVKLSRVRVADLVASGRGSYFDPGHGRLMREWISLEDGGDSLKLAREAREYVRGGARRS